MTQAATPTTPEALEARDVRALTEYMVPYKIAPGMYRVVAEKDDKLGKCPEYMVDVELRACECMDFQKRNPEGGCKHLRRVDIQYGDRKVPSWANRDKMDPLLVQAIEATEQ